MDAVVLKITTRGNSSPLIIKIDRECTRLGRAYDNDTIISDPFVAAHQFELVKSDEAYRLQIVEPVNPVFHNHMPVEETHCLLTPGDSVMVGRTRIELLRADSEVAPTKHQFMSSWQLSSKVGPLLAIGTLLICSIVDALVTYWQTSSTLEWREPAYLSLFSIGMIFIWAAVWALVGRLLKHQSLFFVQLFLTALVCGLFIFLFPLAEFVVFNINSTTIGDYVGYVIWFLFLFLLLKANLAIATNIQRTSLAASFAGLFIIGAVFFAERYSEAEFEYRQDYPSTIKPPSTVIRTPISIDDYLFDIGTIRDEFDAS